MTLCPNCDKSVPETDAHVVGTIRREKIYNCNPVEGDEF